MSKRKMWDEEFSLQEFNGVPMTTSRKVAEIFEKEHKNILQSISKIVAEDSGLSKDFTELNFQPSEYRDATGRKQPEYLLTRDGFVLLVMGFVGQKAMRFKEAYIKRFNDMEQYIFALNTARLEFPELTQAILMAHENPKHYHFSNEMDMINRIVLGMTAKQFKQAHNLGDVQSIRPYLTADQIKYIGMLQKADIGFVLIDLDFQTRKEKLQEYYYKIKLRQQEMLSA